MQSIVYSKYEDQLSLRMSCCVLREFSFMWPGDFYIFTCLCFAPLSFPSLFHLGTLNLVFCFRIKFKKVRNLHKMVGSIMRSSISYGLVFCYYIQAFSIRHLAKMKSK